MRSSKIYRAAREYLGLRKEDVCCILGWNLEDLEAIESGVQPSLDMEGQLYKLYRLNPSACSPELRDYDLPEGLSAHDAREVVKMFLFADEVKRVDRD